MKIRTMLAAVVVGVSMSMSAVWCAAQHPVSPEEIPPPPGEGAHAPTTAHEPAYPHPILPGEDVWPGVMLICVAGMFLMAIGAGLIRRVENLDELPPAHGHGHGDDHGHGGGHGHEDAHAADHGHGHH